jgi:hypothetical protein
MQLCSTGEWVIYATVRHPDGEDLYNCTNPSAARSPAKQFEERRGHRIGATTDPVPPPRHTYMTYSMSPYGPWSTPGGLPCDASPRSHKFDACAKWDLLSSALPCSALLCPPLSISSALLSFFFSCLLFQQYWC